MDITFLLIKVTKSVIAMFTYFQVGPTWRKCGPCTTHGAWGEGELSSRGRSKHDSILVNAHQKYVFSIEKSTFSGGTPTCTFVGKYVQILHKGI
jgi:hypothetical protein